ncbi:MAG: hypothetical protein KGZ40_05825 [Clostridiales bacterium]|nr:hypothetical protein [Clostridiales bacterium]
MRRVNEGTSLGELAALVCEALERAGIRATLSGGGAVVLYSDNEYESSDLDFITSERTAVIAEAIEPLGFHRTPGSRQFEHPEARYYVEFPPGPLAFGETVVPESSVLTLQTEFGPVRVITPTQSVMDRLAAYVHWNDNQALDQAVMVARRQRVDWSELYEWARREGADAVLIDRLRSKAGFD